MKIQAKVLCNEMIWDLAYAFRHERFANFSCYRYDILLCIIWFILQAIDCHMSSDRQMHVELFTGQDTGNDHETRCFISQICSSFFHIRPQPPEKSGSRLISERQTSERRISSWVGDDQRTPGVVCFLHIQICFLLILFAF